MTDDKLARLKARLETNQNEAKTIKDEIKKLEKQKQAAQRKADQTARNRELVLIGVAMREEMKENPAFKATVDALIDKHLYKDSERAVFGLPPRKNTPKSAPTENKNKPISQEEINEKNDELV